MAHGKKRFIRDWRGHLKRSRHRTQQDWKGELGSAAFVRRTLFDRKCPQCTLLRKDIGHGRHAYADCASCRKKRNVAWYWRYEGDVVTGCTFHSNAPKWFRRMIHQERRAEYKDLLRRAKYDPELYDLIPVSYHRDAAWRWI